jgi:hypothetical protein
MLLIVISRAAALDVECQLHQKQPFALSLRYLRASEVETLAPFDFAPAALRLT